MTTAALVSAFAPDFRNLYKGLQSHRAASDFRQHVSLALERQLSGQLANSLINLPPVQNSNFQTTPKPHPPLAASNSIAACKAVAVPHNREHRKLDRSVSEPAQPQQVQPPNSSRYKTELCRPFEESGTCKYGDKCQFAHGYSELRTLTRHPKYKTELCRTFHSTGFCPYGPRCHFIHNSEDSKKCLLTSLQSNNGSLSPTSTGEYDCGFSISSGGELSPTCSLSSGSPTSSVSGFFLDETSTRPHNQNRDGNNRFQLEEGNQGTTISGFLNETSTKMQNRFQLEDSNHGTTVSGFFLEETSTRPQNHKGFPAEDSNHGTSNSGFFLEETSKIQNGFQLEDGNQGYFLDESGIESQPPGFYAPLKPLSCMVPGEDYLSRSVSSDDEVMSSLGAMMSDIDLDEQLSESAGESTAASEPVDINRNLIRLPIFSRLSLGSSP